MNPWIPPKHIQYSTEALWEGENAPSKLWHSSHVHCETGHQASKYSAGQVTIRETRYLQAYTVSVVLILSFLAAWQMNLWTLTPSLALKKGVNSSPARCSPRKCCLVVGGQPAPRTCSQGLLCPSGSSCSGPGRWSTTKRKNAANPGRENPAPSRTRSGSAQSCAQKLLQDLHEWSLGKCQHELKLPNSY